MLEEKLRQANEASVKNRKRLVLMLSITVLICIAFIGMASFVDVNPPSPASKENTATEKPPQQTDLSALRSQFIHQLRMYEEETEPTLAGANLQAWATDQASKITLLKEEATASFAAGDYATALEKLSASETIAKQTLAQRDAIFSSQLALARKALENDQEIESKLHISKALLVNPDNRQALELSEQIRILPQILALLKQATIAHTENNPEKEYAAVVEAFKLDPHRVELKQRAEILAENIRESQFTPLIARGLANVEKRNIKAARSSYQQAKTLYPERSELHILKAAIARLATELDLDAAIKQGKTAIAQDDWRKAHAIYAAAAKKHPDDQTILDGLQLSERIVALHSALAEHIKHSARLSVPSVSEDARSLLVQAKVFSRNSLSLSRQISELNTLIAGMNKKIPVSVKSDNQTYILVRGVGKVGTINEKTIRLKPGFYTFEGIRKGYRSKLVEVRIPAGISAFAVEVICDKHI